MKLPLDIIFIWKVRRLILWGAAISVSIWLGFLFYQNWYRVVINPAPLDPALTERRQTSVSTEVFDAIETLDSRWRDRPGLPQPVNVFDATRVIE